MKTISLEQITLDTCVTEAQRENIIITRNGDPVMLIVGVDGLDEDQVALGSSHEFWQMIGERRTQPTLDRAALERAASEQAGPPSLAP